MADFPWENDRNLFLEVMNHGRFFLNMQLFSDVRDRDQMKVHSLIFLVTLRVINLTLQVYLHIGRLRLTRSSSMGACPKAGSAITRPTGDRSTGNKTAGSTLVLLLTPSLGPVLTKTATMCACFGEF